MKIQSIDKTRHKNKSGTARLLKENQCGNVLVIIFVAIGVLAMLTVAVMRGSRRPADSLTQERLTQQVNQLLSHAGLMATVVNQMISDRGGDDALDGMGPDDTNFNAAPHSAKIYHPYGGGMEYKTTVGGASNLLFHDDITVTGVGLDAAAELLLSASIDTEELCLEINQELYGSAATIPTMGEPAYSRLRTGSAAATIEDGTNCNGCDDISYQCVTDASTYTYYHVLYAR